ncbi:unnamed protein product [Zymoseptoria tritici ST99CH_1E4]|uniref:Uncharacterized protein n=1 Tax=Zymoseptoria tritici ST99CH_1E4 TaxID=1276532 RepID=A0A2H1H3C6_ZYMTR|nr:unnamed protein product [Zymoseptoria tritici ST99CH_1E4]
MATGTFAVFQQARRTYRATDQLHDLTTDLGKLLEADARVVELEANLTDRQKDRRRLHKIETLEPKLEKRILQLRNDIYDETKKIGKIQQETKQAEWWASKIQSMGGKTGELSEAEQLVEKAKADFIERFGLPEEIFDQTWIAAYQEYVNDSTHQPSTPDLCVTTDTDILDMFRNNQDVVKRHPSGQGFTTSSVVAFLKTMHGQLSSLKQKYENLELQHAEDVEGLKEEHELEMENMQTQVSNVEAERGEWQEKYNKAVLSHSDCGQMKNEYDRLIGEEKEYIAARAETVGLRKQLEHAEETRQSTEQELDYLKANLSPDAAELIELRALVEHQKSVIADDLISENQSQEASDLLALYKHENDLLLKLGGQLLDCYVHADGVPEAKIIDMSLLAVVLCEKNLNLEIDPVATSEPAVNPVTFYADHDTPNRFSLSALVAQRIGVRVDYGPSDLLGAVMTLERVILPDLMAHSSIEAASLVYRYTEELAASRDLSSDAFLSTCAVFETLHLWYPHEDAGEYVNLLETMLKKRYADLPGDLLPPLLDQVCIYHLGTTLPEPSDIFAVYSAAVHQGLLKAGSLVTSQHSIMEIATMAFGTMSRSQDSSAIARYMSGSAELIVIRDQTFGAGNPVEYLFWRVNDDGVQWAFSTLGLDVAVTGVGNEKKRWVCSPRRQVQSFHASFEFEEEDDPASADLQSYLRTYYSEQVQDAYRMPNAYEGLEDIEMEVSDSDSSELSF